MTGGDADGHAPQQGVCEEAGLSEERRAGPTGARLCACVCAWRGARRGGGREAASPDPVAAPGAAPPRAWDRRAPAAAACWRDSRPVPRPPASAAGSASCPPRRRFSRAPGVGSARRERK